MSTPVNRLTIDQDTDMEATPVDLDPPHPALARWGALAERAIVIEHGGNVEPLMPFPRPPWSSVEDDIIGTTLGGCYYVSEWVRVPVRFRRGYNDEVYQSGTSKTVAGNRPAAWASRSPKPPSWPTRCWPPSSYWRSQPPSASDVREQFQEIGAVTR